MEASYLRQMQILMLLNEILLIESQLNKTWSPQPQPLLSSASR